MDEREHEYTGGTLMYSVTPGERGPTLRFLRDDEVIATIQLGHIGAIRLGRELIGGSFED